MSLIPGLGSIIVAIIVLIILWVIISIPVYIAGKFVAGRRSTLGRAMGATVVGPIVFAIVLGLGELFFGSSTTITAIALILAFLAWLWVYKEMFRTGWLGALGIAILSIIVTVIIIVILAVIGLALLII